MMYNNRYNIMYISSQSFLAMFFMLKLYKLSKSNVLEVTKNRIKIFLKTYNKIATEIKFAIEFEIAISIFAARLSTLFAHA